MPSGDGQNGLPYSLEATPILRLSVMTEDGRAHDGRCPQSPGSPFWSPLHLHNPQSPQSDSERAWHTLRHSEFVMTSLAGEIVSGQIGSQGGCGHAGRSVFLKACPQWELARLNRDVSFVGAARERIQAGHLLCLAELPESFKVRRQMIEHPPVLKRYQYLGSRNRNHLNWALYNVYIARVDLKNACYRFRFDDRTENGGFCSSVMRRLPPRRIHVASNKPLDVSILSRPGPKVSFSSSTVMAAIVACPETPISWSGTK